MEKDILGVLRGQDRYQVKDEDLVDKVEFNWNPTG